MKINYLLIGGIAAFSGFTRYKDLFEAWLKNCLLPVLEPGDIIIIDNASFHKGESIKELVAEAGCEIWYLPPYSPDLNKIENWWAVLKTWMKQRLKEFQSGARMRGCCL